MAHLFGIIEQSVTRVVADTRRVFCGRRNFTLSASSRSEAAKRPSDKKKVFDPDYFFPREKHPQSGQVSPSLSGVLGPMANGRQKYLRGGDRFGRVVLEVEVGV